MGLNEKEATLDLLLDDAVAICDCIRKKRKEINNLARIRVELQERFSDEKTDDFEIEITRLTDELGVLFDDAFRLKMSREDILESIKYYESKIYEYEWSNSIPKDEIYYRFREYLLSNTIRMEIIDNKLDSINNTSKPIRTELQNSIINLIGTITAIYPDFSNNQLFTISPRVHITAKRKAFECAKKNYRTDGKKVYRTFIDSAFDQIDERCDYLSHSLNKDYSSLYEVTSKIIDGNEDGYGVVTELLRYANGDIKKKSMSIKVKKIGSINKE